MRRSRARVGQLEAPGTFGVPLRRGDHLTDVSDRDAGVEVDRVARGLCLGAEVQVLIELAIGVLEPRLSDPVEHVPAYQHRGAGAIDRERLIVVRELVIAQVAEVATELAPA